MSDDTEAGLRGRLRPRSGAPVRGAMGDPNVLTGAAAPNRLSDQTAPPAAIPTSPRGRAAAPEPASPTTRTPVARRPGLPPSDDDATAPRRRIPPLPTLIFFGFLALTGIRLINEFAQSFGPSEPTAPPAAATARPVGSITFGTDLSNDCDLDAPAVTFSPGTDVWWLAELPTRQGKDAIVVVRVLFNSGVVARDAWPPDGASFWTVMCDGPVARNSIGNYRIEVWNEDESILQAAGEYQVR